MFDLFKFSFLCLLLLAAKASSAENLDLWAQNLLQRTAGSNSGEKVASISSAFLGTPYRANTLIGSHTSNEVFVTQLHVVDCMTYLEYVEALRRSRNPADFTNSLRNLRYKNGQISYATRRHFFSDWLEQKEWLQDVTRQVGGKAALSVTKQLNQGSEKLLLPGVASPLRTLHYIPSFRLSPEVLGNLQSGDYVGMYTDREGLDVNHVGIVIKTDSQLLFRHADPDAPNRKVVDVDFLKFFKHQRGILVYRATNP